MNEILRNNIKSLKLNGVMVEITCKDSAGLTLVKDTMRANTATFGVFKGSMTVPNNSFVRYTYNDTAASEAAFKKLQAIVGTATAASTTAPAAPKETPTTAVEAIPVDTTAETTTETTTEATSEQPLDSKPLKTNNKKTIVIAAVALVALVALVFIIKKKRK